MTTLTEQQVVTLKDAARKLTGAKRRAFEAQVALAGVYKLFAPKGRTS